MHSGNGCGMINLIMGIILVYACACAICEAKHDGVSRGAETRHYCLLVIS